MHARIPFSIFRGRERRIFIYVALCHIKDILFPVTRRPLFKRPSRKFIFCWIRCIWHSNYLISRGKRPVWEQFWYPMECLECQECVTSLVTKVTPKGLLFSSICVNIVLFSMQRVFYIKHVSILYCSLNKFWMHAEIKNFFN